LERGEHQPTAYIQRRREDGKGIILGTNRFRLSVPSMEEDRHHEGMREPDLGSIYEPVPSTLEYGEVLVSGRPSAGEGRKQGRPKEVRTSAWSEAFLAKMGGGTYD
jgi:hypothetical protein